MRRASSFRSSRLVRTQKSGHLQRLRVMADHTLHEADVGFRVTDLRLIDRGSGRNRAGRLSRGPRLDEGRTAAISGGFTGNGGGQAENAVGEKPGPQYLKDTTRRLGAPEQPRG